MNANAIIKSFLFMMYTSNASGKSEGAKRWGTCASLFALCFALLFRRQCRGGRVLTIELSNEGFGDIQRFGGANDTLNFGDIEYQRDAVGLGIDIEGLADVLIDWAHDFLEPFFKGRLSVFAFTRVVFLHLLDFVVLLRGDFRILDRRSSTQIGSQLINLRFQAL